MSGNFKMRRRHRSWVVRALVAFAALGLLSAFSYPLVQEGYERAGASAFQKAQVELLGQSIREYARMKSPGWDVNTPTRDILQDLAAGIDRDLDGRPEGLLPSSATVDALNSSYRIVYKGSTSFKILPRR